MSKTISEAEKLKRIVGKINAIVSTHTAFQVLLPPPELTKREVGTQDMQNQQGEANEPLEVAQWMHHTQKYE